MLRCNLDGIVFLFSLILIDLQEANDTIVRRWIWRDSPWKKANYDDISDLDSHTKMLHPSALEEERFSRTVRALRSHIAPYFQRSFCLDIRKLVWYPESCQQFLSKYEAAAHHLHYNRLEDFINLLSSDKDLVRQVHLCQVRLCLSPT